VSSGNVRHSGVQLLKDEDVFRVVHPHFLGMYRLYLIWFYFIATSVVFMVKREAIIAKVAAMAPTFAHNTIYIAVWSLALIIPAIVIALGRISLRWAIWIMLAGGVGIYLKEFTPVGTPGSAWHLDNVENAVVAAFGILGVMGTEWYRMCHSYHVTNRRIVISSQGLWHSERSLPYDKINDLILHKGLLGNVLDFGSIIPLTASGIGAGSEMAGGGIGVGASLFGVNLGVGVGGGHSRNVPKESLAYTLFNIPAPDEIHAYILDRMTRK